MSVSPFEPAKKSPRPHLWRPCFLTRSLSRSNFQPSFHSGMVAADVGHVTTTLQNRPARSSGREIDVKTPVRRGCGMPQDIEITPLDNVVDFQARGGGPTG